MTAFSTPPTRTREPSRGEDRPRASRAAPGTLHPDTDRPIADPGREQALKRSRQGQAASRSPSASLDPPTGPATETPAAPAAPCGLRPLPARAGEDPANPPMSVSSIETSEEPIEQTDMRCPKGQRHQFMVGGRLITREMPCDVKSCPACGPRLQRELVATWAHAMASDQVYRLVVDEGEPAKLRRRKHMAGKELVHLPLPNGRRAVYTTAPIGDRVQPADALARDVAADPGDGRRRSKLSEGWAAVVADVEAEATREQWTWLGRVSRSLEHVEIEARTLGIFVGRMPDMVITETTDPLVRALFLKRIRCRGPWQEWGDAAAKAVAA
jgi:hypothetical protein